MQIVGPLESPSGLILASGFSGHGFAIGPGVGSLIAEYIAAGRWSDMLKPFDIERFDKSAEEIS